MGKYNSDSLINNLIPAINEPSLIKKKETYKKAIQEFQKGLMNSADLAIYAEDYKKSIASNLEKTLPKDLVSKIVEDMFDPSKFNDPSILDKIAEDAEKAREAFKAADEAFKTSVSSLQLIKAAQDELSGSHTLSEKTLQGIMDRYPKLLKYKDDEAKQSEILKQALEDEKEIVEKLSILIEIQKEMLQEQKDSYAAMHRELREIKVRTQEMSR